MRDASGNMRPNHMGSLQTPAGLMLVLVESPMSDLAQHIRNHLLGMHQHAPTSAHPNTTLPNMLNSVNAMIPPTTPCGVALALIGAGQVWAAHLGNCRVLAINEIGLVQALSQNINAATRPLQPSDRILLKSGNVTVSELDLGLELSNNAADKALQRLLHGAKQGSLLAYAPPPIKRPSGGFNLSRRAALIGGLGGAALLCGGGGLIAWVLVQAGTSSSGSGTPIPSQPGQLAPIVTATALGGAAPSLPVPTATAPTGRPTSTPAPTAAALTSTPTPVPTPTPTLRSIATSPVPPKSPAQTNATLTPTHTTATSVAPPTSPPAPPPTSPPAAPPTSPPAPPPTSPPAAPPTSPPAPTVCAHKPGVQCDS